MNPTRLILAPKDEEPKVSPLVEADKQAIRQTVDKAREKADEVDLETLSEGLASVSSSLHLKSRTAKESF